MSSLINIPEMEKNLQERGVSVSDLCKKAEINPSTWFRWRTTDTQPNLKTWDRVLCAYKALVKQKETAHQAPEAAAE